MSRTWRDAAAAEVGAPEPPAPTWTDGVPGCSYYCPHHDGKRCRLLGLRPGNICEPVVVAMASMLERAAKGAGW